MKKVVEYIAGFLVENGIERVFSVTGGGAMHLNDALGHREGLKCVYNHHEQACAIAAEAYARIHNKIAAVCVTTGPGGINALTGVAGGYLDSIPMLVLSGQVRFDTTARSTGLGIRALGDQEFDITKAAWSMTKYCEMVTDPMRIRYCLEKALYIAKSGRPGPCWLDIPLNVQGAYIEETELEGFDAEVYEKEQLAKQEKIQALQNGAVQEEVLKTEAGEEWDAIQRTVNVSLKPCPVSVETVANVLERIKTAERPVIYAGNGIRIAGAFEVFRRVADKLGIAVVTGWNSIDIIEDENPLYVGRGGIMGDRAGNFAVQNSDLVVAIGSRLSIRQVGYNYKTWARGAYVVMVDADSEELKKPTLHVDMPIHADALDFLLKMDELLAEKLSEKKAWMQQCRTWKANYPVVMPKHYEDTDKVNVYAFIGKMSSMLKEGQITVVGNGSACVVGSHAYVIKKGQRFIINSAIASMGYDLPAAIGACFAQQDGENASRLLLQAREEAETSSDVKSSKESYDREVILVTGDGSIQMNLQELQTIIHHKLPIKIFLINNGGYHSIRQTQKNFFGEPLVGVGDDSYDLSFPSMEKLSYAYGYPYYKVEDNAKLEEVLGEVLLARGPLVCEVFVNRTQNFEPKSATKRLEDGTLVSAPLEDLAPFLPKEELKANMLIPLVEEN